MGAPTYIRQWKRCAFGILNVICDLRLRDCLPLLAAIVLLLYVLGYFIGYVQFRSHKNNSPESVNRATELPFYSSNVISQSAATATAGPNAVSVSTYSVQPLNTQTWKPSPVGCSLTPSGGRKRDYGRWYDYSVAPVQFYAYSAIWDDRPSLQLPRPVIRIIAISSNHNSDGWSLQTPHSVFIDMSCRLYYADGRIVVLPMNPLAHPIGWGWPLNRETVREFIFTCPSSADQTDSDVRPVAVEVLLGTPFWSYEFKESCMPIEFPDKTQEKRNLAICVQVSYGSLNALKLIEWLELQRILGVEMIAIYNMSITDGPVGDVLRYYSQTISDGLSEPFVDLRRSDYIRDGPQQYLLHGSPVINDCMYRHMYRFRHIVVIDFDEAIIPQGNTLSLNDLIADIKRRESSIPIPPKNYIFANNYFFFDYTPVVSIAPPAIKDVREFLASELTVLKFQRKAPLSPYGYSVKSIIDPQACLQMHNHYCWSLTPQFVGGPLTYVVDSSLGLNQHYKYCHLNSTECDVLNQRSTTDTTMFKYRQRLVENVASKLAAVFGDSTSVIARLL